MKFCNHERERMAFPELRRPLRVPETSVRTETCPKICQLEFRATKIAMALLAAEPNWQCSQALIGGGVRWLTPFKCILMTVDRNEIVIFQGSQLIEKTRPEKGFFIKSKKRYLSPKDGREHSKFSWEPVTVGDLWADETDRKCQMHFVVYRSSGSIEQVDQPISRQSYTLFGSYKLDAHRVDLIDKVLRKNRTGLRIRKWTATEMLHLKVTKRLMDELLGNAEKCGQNLSQYCTTLLSGKHPRAAFTDEELDLLRNLKKSRGDVLLQFNAMVAEFAHKSDEERLRAVIYGKSFDWWREHLITALEFFDRMRDRTLNMGG